MSTVLSRWTETLSRDRAALALAERRVAYWRKRKAAAKRGTPTYSHAGAQLARRERDLKVARERVAYDGRVIERHSAIERRPAHALSLSPHGAEMIGGFEGLRLTAYRDAVGVLTIGYGHTGADVKPGQRISTATALALLRRDAQSAEAAVERAVKVPLTQGQFDALVSLTFNIGGGALASSTLVRKLNAGDVKGAANQFLRWDKAGGRTLLGLSRRRRAERALFLS